MTENKSYIYQIYGLYNALRETFFSKNIGFSVIRLVFLKYAFDNCLGAFTREDMQKYYQTQKIFMARDVNSDPKYILPILDIIDEHYHLPCLMHNSINEYAKELFGMDESWNKKNVTEKNFVEIMSILSSMDLTEDSELFEKGKALVITLIDNLQYHGENARFASPYYSRREIGILVNKILDVQDDDTFLDFCSGIGTTTISIVGEKKAKIINYDVNEEALSVAAMLYIMSGYEDFVVDKKNRLESASREISDYHSAFEIADKIFVDPPIGLKIKEHLLRESTLVSLSDAAALLKENGTAVVAVSSSTLSGMGNIGQLLRERLVGNLFVQSVIALPITWTRTTMTINLVVLSKKKNREVLFVNFCTSGLKGLLSINSRTGAKLRGGSLFSDEDLETMASVINKNEEIEGISRIVSMHEIVSKEYNLLPNVYVSEVVMTEDISVQEIDFELKELYGKLIDMTK